MQFNRYSFMSNLIESTYSDIGTVQLPVNFTTFIKSCGFVNIDGSEIDTSTVFQEFKWKYDTYENCPKFRRSDRTSGYTYTSVSFHPIKTSSTSYNFLWDGGHNITSRYAVFFIPLKNNGFLFLNYNLDTSYKYYTTTPQLLSLSKANYFSWNNDDRSYCSGVLGFYNNISNNYSYFHGYQNYYDIAASVAYRQYATNTGVTMYNYGTTISDITNLRDYYANKTDYKQNVCTLIKVPYENGFLSNLFIVSTSPSPEQIAARDFDDWRFIGTDNKFFSFNGRNFYGFMNNFAVELPST